MNISAGSFLHTRPALDGQAVPSPWNLFKGQRQNAVPDLCGESSSESLRKGTAGAWRLGARGVKDNM